MRRHLTSRSLPLALVALLAPVPALADDAPAPGATLDVSGFADQLVLLTDGNGNYVAAAPGSGSYDKVFIGDGKLFTQVRSFGGSHDGTSGNFSSSMWAPRVDSRASVERRGGKWTVQCGKRETALTVVEPARAGALLAKARFQAPIWQRSAYALARDDRGIYYYVDRLRREYGGKGFRLFIGPKGRLSLTKLVNIVSDSEGDIFSTRRGELRLVLDKSSSVWVRGKRRTDLKLVPVEKNVAMIYAELGVYTGETLGTPCDRFPYL